MKLLIITQKVDKNDPILGFFHRWIEEFAKHCEKITVICLQKGEYDLPENVKVLSLGKEKGCGKLKYVFNFYKYIWRERKNYDTVFVHMNQEYVILGWKFWKLFNKKIFLWRNHAKGNFFTKLAVFFSDKVFCTSKYSYTARFKKTEIMPVGIDTNFFKPDSSVKKIKNSILFLGRIDPVKNVHIFVEALKILDKEDVDFIVSIYGNPSDKHRKYYYNIRKQSFDLEMKGKIIFYKSVANTQTLFVYLQNEFFVNVTNNGSFDKTIFEAMACEVLPIVSNKTFTNIIPKQLIFEENNPLDFSEKIKYAMNLNQYEKEKIIRRLRYFVIKNHTLKILASDIFIQKNRF